VAEPLPRLYPIVNVTGEGAAEIARARDLAVTVAAAGAPLLQLRAKTLAAGPLTELAVQLVASLARFSCRLVVNDRADVAAAAGAAGVHLGDEDLEPCDARALLGPAAIIGYSTHSPEEAAAADHLPVDYLGFGPVFDSPTKAGVRHARGLDALAAACSGTSVPVVAIGGVTLETAASVLGAGAASVAVIRDLELADDATAITRRYLAL